MTLRDYEALGAALREASTSVYHVVRTTPADTRPVELVMLIHRVYEMAIEGFATQVRLPRSVEDLPASLQEPVRTALKDEAIRSQPPLHHRWVRGSTGESVAGIDKTRF
jgi:hypothetical protein